ncbi:16S rRNA (guanine(1207)-N(2))-methyltransferase RsmC [Psychrobium sp. 1_MG-2023]|uniref:16S rRNA (guanine(1207)-N(2))-methyltransferase RsmC n=1 Tax=Psychrobium sp. 1_MG-2023 TaxID=3062624 RepID=UPI000C32321F|nr:16S rRNA (guanine(1207)-N(2))-methyltransferase RsmC [Psychrobium sp. 1_MG-2023]MDP2560957.1 16S rRNA (guanine(1207)-N(2))-methyltransferase RsmC [Psychrobium sp. 1_MG-2023]PKF56029.1 16S rRNA (guanine(1207)-N(2))-methyltransferase RsmC [Alteromonadales bacterium alter-6D02]
MSTLSNPSQVLVRNIELFEQQRVLVAGFSDDNFINELYEAGASQVTAFGLDYHNHKHVTKTLKHDNAKIQFGAYFENPQQHKWQQLILYWPKAKQRALYLLANLLPHLETNAEIYFVGDNKSGVKSAAKLISDFCDKPVKVDSARHCALFRTEYTKAAPNFDKNQWLKTYQIQAADLTVNVTSLPGVFSHGELDLGTELLLENLGHLKMKRTLDFGCGCGVIGTYIGLKRPGIPLELVDIDALALESTRLTLAANGVEGKVYPSDGLSDIKGKIATIVSNPPFHTGIKTDYKVPEQFMSTAPQHLMDGGQLRIVANSFLRYEPILKQYFATTESIIENSKFKILSAKT